METAALFRGRLLLLPACAFPCHRSAPVPGRSSVNKQTGFSKFGCAYTANLAAPEDGRTPAPEHYFAVACCSCQLARFPATGVRPSPGAAASINRQALVSLGALILPSLLRLRTGPLRPPIPISRWPAAPASLRASLPSECARPRAQQRQ